MARFVPPELWGGLNKNRKKGVSEAFVQLCNIRDICQGRVNLEVPFLSLWDISRGGKVANPLTLWKQSTPEPSKVVVEGQGEILQEKRRYLAGYFGTEVNILVYANKDKISGSKEADMKTIASQRILCKY